MEEFNSREWMRGTSFSIGDDEKTVYKKFGDLRSKEEIENMLEQARERMYFFKRKYIEYKKIKDKQAQLSAARNYKALEGLYNGLRWVLRDSEIHHPLY